MRRVLLVTAMLVAAGALTVQLWGSFQPQSSSGSAAGRFIGTWRLVSVQTNGKPNPNRGVRPTGLIIYDAAGHMAVQIAPERTRPSWPPTAVPTPDQAKEAATGTPHILAPTRLTNGQGRSPTIVKMPSTCTPLIWCDATSSRRMGSSFSFRWTILRTGSRGSGSSKARVSWCGSVKGA